jgi:hypothetical protein
MSDEQGTDNDALNQGGEPEHASVNNAPANTVAANTAAARQSVTDKDQPLTVDQAFELFDKLQESEDRFRSTIQRFLPAQPADPFATIKRRADAINNEGIKKQYVALEETKLRLEAARDAVKEVVEGAKPAIGPEEAAQLQKTLDEGLAEVSSRIAHLEIAEVEGWSVAKQMEKNRLMMELPDDLQKQLKQVRKDAKNEEAEKDKKKGGQKSKGFHPYRRGNGFRGGHHGFGRGSGSFEGGGGYSKGGPMAFWACGQVGHISSFCPVKGMQASAASRQMS